MLILLAFGLWLPKLFLLRTEKQTFSVQMSKKTKTKKRRFNVVSPQSLNADDSWEIARGRRRRRHARVDENDSKPGQAWTGARPQRVFKAEVKMSHTSVMTATKQGRRRQMQQAVKLLRIAEERDVLGGLMQEKIDRCKESFWLFFSIMWQHRDDKRDENSFFVVWGVKCNFRIDILPRLRRAKPSVTKHNVAPAPAAPVQTRPGRWRIRTRNTAVHEAKRSRWLADVRELKSLRQTRWWMRAPVNLAAPSQQRTTKAN